MITLGTGQVYLNNKRETFTLYKASSAENHKTSDDATLKQELLKALNLPDNKKEAQEANVFRVRINERKGYLVYKVNVDGTPNSACIFHFHWNYHLDLPLSAT